MTLTPDLITFFLLAIVAIGAAAGMVLSRNAVHSALFLVMNFAVVSVFYLLLNAPFIAMVQVTVYAGAIMVLFLFVIMLLGAELLIGTSGTDGAPSWQPALALVLGVVFAGALIYTITSQGLAAVAPGLGGDEAVRDFGSPRAVGMLLYTTYLLPFELTSLLLLVAMIGAVILTRDRRGRGIQSTASNIAGRDSRASGD